MPTIFTRIIEGELPGSFVWRDDRAVGVHVDQPLATGHVLVVPTVEVDHWIDLDAELAAHLFEVARVIGRAQTAAFTCAAGRSDRRRLRGAAHPPARDPDDFDEPARTLPTRPPGSIQPTLEVAAEAIRAELRAAGRAEVTPP